MNPSEETSGWSRRALLGGIGLGAGLGIAGAGLLTAGAASADDGESVLADSPGARVSSTPTALNPALKYVMISGDSVRAGASQVFSQTANGHFSFDTTGGAWRLQYVLPMGSVIKEVELYGGRDAGTVSLSLFKQFNTAGTNAEAVASATTPAGAGEFTLTLTVNETVTAERTLGIGGNISNAAGSTGRIFGVRIGYVSATGFVPLPPGITPRVLDTRQGGSKLAPNEERTLTLPVPGGVAAVLTLTLTQTEGAGFVSLYTGGIAWPGTSSVNFDGSDVANTVIVPVSSDSKVTIRGGGANTGVLLDVTGWIA